MRTFRARFLTVGMTAAVLSATLAACSGSNSNSGGTGKGPILIGASLSLTGSFSADGQAFMRGYELWAHDQNAAGRLLGPHIRPVLKNDASQPHQTVTNYQKL